MPANTAEHDKLVGCWIISLLIPCVNCVVPGLLVVIWSVENYSVMKKFQKMRDLERPVGIAPSVVGMPPTPVSQMMQR